MRKRVKGQFLVIYAMFLLVLAITASCLYGIAQLHSAFLQLRMSGDIVSPVAVATTDPERPEYKLWIAGCITQQPLHQLAPGTYWLHELVPGCAYLEVEDPKIQIHDCGSPGECGVTVIREKYVAVMGIPVTLRTYTTIAFTH